MSGRPNDAPILLVEDDPALGTILARHLEAHGHVTRVERTAERAAQALRAGFRPAVVILDINLPGETGWSLLRGDLLKAAGNPSVIVATATHVSSARLREFGVAGYLPKPFPLETLVSTIERVTKPESEE